MVNGKNLSRIEWVVSSCQLLAQISKEFEQTQPFSGLTIGTAIHLEPKTAALLLTLKSGGANVIATGNLNSTQTGTVSWLRKRGIEVLEEHSNDATSHADSLNGLIARQPDILLDNGGDLFARVASSPYKRLLGGTEETTSGRMRLEPLRSKLNLPILVINDSPIKQFAENKHAVGQSIFESYMRFTNRSTNGKNVTVFGYGACGKGVAQNFRNANSIVSVVETNPVTRLEAHLDGFVTPARDLAISTADLIITETGADNIIAGIDLPLLKNGVILMNGGHFPTEISVDNLKEDKNIKGILKYNDEDIETLVLNNQKQIHILGNGHMANLAGPRPLGNSIESMDLGFALQARCLERVASGKLDENHCVVPVPADIDAQVASEYLKLNT